MDSTPKVLLRPAISVFAAFAILVALDGCSGSSHPTNSGSSTTASFNVTSVQPASGATGVAINAPITVTFSGAANASSVTTTHISLTGTSAVAGTVAWDSENNTATFTPGAALAANTMYTLQVAGVTSSTGVALSSAFKSTFTTVVPTSSATTQFTAPLFATDVGGSSSGQISVDTDGNVSVQLTGATASTTYNVVFCPGADSQNTNYGQNQPACILVGKVTSDASGSGTSTNMFPQPGDWAGDFLLDPGGGTALSSSTTNITGLGSSSPSATYSAMLLPQTKTNGGIVTTRTQQEGLTSGSISFSQGVLQVTVTGASPSTAYVVADSESTVMDSSGTEVVGTGFTTDASGDGSMTTTSIFSGDLFQAAQNTGTEAGFVAGFSVP